MNGDPDRKTWVERPNQPPKPECCRTEGQAQASAAGAEDRTTVWKHTQVTELLEKPELIRAELERRRQESLKSDPLERRRGQLTQELKRVEQQIDKLLDAYQEGLLPLGQLRQRMPQLRRQQQTAGKEVTG